VPSLRLNVEEIKQVLYCKFGEDELHQELVAMEKSWMSEMKSKMKA
jgi:hypothetical protein